MRIGIVHTGKAACRCHEAFRRAVRALGHEAVVVENERLAEGREALRGCALVFEHSDTYRGRYEFQHLVRERLARWKCRVVGTPAKAASRVDNKLATHRTLKAAGVPMPRFASLSSAENLPFPRVVKGIWAHNSVGLCFVREPAAWRRVPMAGGVPRFVEEFIPGRELALAAYERGGRPVWLPIVEIAVPAEGLYTHARKWGSHSPGKRLAELPRRIAAEARRLGAVAWRALGLRDYARFDLRLTPSGRLVFLEANVRPSVERGSEMMFAAKAAGIAPAELVRRMANSALARGGGKKNF
jgi:D-alanine-D-alanine ligase-like ATP-grasp enzyme